MFFYKYKKTTQKAPLPMPLVLSTRGERSSMTEKSNKVNFSSLPHAQGKKLCLLIVGASTLLLGREKVRYTTEMIL